jgi:hypothetical protein
MVCSARPGNAVVAQVGHQPRRVWRWTQAKTELFKEGDAAIWSVMTNVRAAGPRLGSSLDDRGLSPPTPHDVSKQPMSVG